MINNNHILNDYVEGDKSMSYFVIGYYGSMLAMLLHWSAQL